MLRNFGVIAYFALVALMVYVMRDAGEMTERLYGADVRSVVGQWFFALILFIYLMSRGTPKS